MPDYTAVLETKMRRAKWFHYARRRLDLLPLEDLVDWCAREPNGFDISASRRANVVEALISSIGLDEFGERDKPQIAFLPKILPTYGIGSFPLRFTFGQLSYFTASGHDMIPDLWAPRPLCRRWLEARGAPLPPWLDVQPEPPATSFAPPPPARALPDLLPKFDRERAKALLAAQKLKGGWSAPPNEDASRKFLLKHFKGVPNDPHREIRNELWPGKIKRGPKPKARAAE